VKFEPRPYQRDIVNYTLEHERCSAWSFMGSGKTISVLTMLDYLYRFGYESRPTLVLAPLRVARSVWPAEAKKWDHLDLEVSAIVGTESERLVALKRDVPVFSCNYENLPWLISHTKNQWPFAAIVADESTRLKGHRLNSGGIRAQALGRVAHSPKVKRWINLTGTPSPNGLIDLWGQQWFVDRGARLGLTFTAFQNRWFRQHPSGYGHVATEWAQEQIQAALADCCLTVDAKDYFDLEEPIVTDVTVDLPPKAMKLYRQMEQEMYIELNGAGVEAFNSASMTMKCLQLANGAIYNQDASRWDEVHDAKLDALGEIIEEAAGEPLIVCYQFKHDLARIKARFKKARELRTAGDEAAWNRGEIPLLVLHPESAGHGLNLQDGGNRIVFFGHWWSLEPYQQVIERIGPVRQMQSGHQRNVFVYHILARNTLDREVMLRRKTKASVQDLLLAAMKEKAA